MFCCIVILLTFSAYAASMKDYYWRPFDGTIPSDAYIAHCDRIKCSYVGNAPARGGLFVGELNGGNKKIIVVGYPPYDDNTGVHFLDDNIQILCTRSSELFQWIPTNSEDINSIKDLISTSALHKVRGGYEAKYSYPFYIGRVNRNGQYTYGRVTSGLTLDFYRNALYAYDENIGEAVTYESYELLVYKGW